MNKFNNKKIFKSGISLPGKELISQLLILKNPGIFRILISMKMNNSNSIVN